MMKKIAAFVLVLSLFINKSSSAQEAITQEGEFGVGIGGGHYFGDLNTRARLNRTKIAATAFFRKNLGNYIAARLGVSFAQLGYSDQYNSYNEYMYLRNLSFNTKVWELTLQGDFNFFRFMPGDPAFSFTPYITLGVGVFNYDPYAYLRGAKVYLRPLGTEGQGSTAPGVTKNKKYSSMGICIPFGGGFKYALNSRVNIGFEILHRFTNTDYIDDVSQRYIDPAYYSKYLSSQEATLAYKLSDKAKGIIYPGMTRYPAGTQRGDLKDYDTYFSIVLKAGVRLGPIYESAFARSAARQTRCPAIY